MILLFWIIFGILTGIIANNKGRNVVGWTVAGFAFGIFAVIAVALVPPLEK